MSEAKQFVQISLEQAPKEKYLVSFSTSKNSFEKEFDTIKEAIEFAHKFLEIFEIGLLETGILK